MTTFDAARAFIYRNARPLELARWQLHFEGASREVVETALSFYQNEDGGFGHGIEPDFWNPDSTPIGTWAATEILRKSGIKDGRLIEGILRYLDSGSHFDASHRQWLNVVPGNNFYPHSVWWEYREGADQFMYNPTAALAGFIVRFADRNSALYQTGCDLAREAFAFFEANLPIGDAHIAGCYVSLYEYCLEAGANVIDLPHFKELLIAQVNHSICRDPAKWESEYVTRPCDFFNSRDSLYYPDNRDAAEAMCDFFVKAQQPDGSFPVTWRWWNDFCEFEVAAAWWRGIFAVENMLYLKNFGKL